MPRSHVGMGIVARKNMKVIMEGDCYWEREKIEYCQYPVLAHVEPLKQENEFERVQEILSNEIGLVLNEVQGEMGRWVIVFTGNDNEEVPIGVSLRWFSGEFEEGEFEDYAAKMQRVNKDIEIPGDGCYGFWWVEISQEIVEKYMAEA